MTHILFENQGDESVFVEKFPCHVLNLLAGDGFHLFVEAINVFLPTIVEEALTEIEGEVLTVVAGNANLTLNLLFGSS